MTVEERLSALERKNRWMSRVLSAFLAAAAALILIGGKDEARSITTKSITTESLTIVPAPHLKQRFGDVQVTFEVTGRDVMRIYDSRGLVRFRLRNDSDAGAILTFYDDNLRQRMQLGTTNDGSPALMMSDQDDVRAVLALNPAANGAAYLRMMDGRGKDRVTLLPSTLAMRDESGRLRFWAGVDPENQRRSMAIIYDKHGASRWRAPPTQR